MSDVAEISGTWSDSIAGLVREQAGGRLSARRLAETSIARIRAGNDRLHAVAELFEAEALSRADALDAARLAGQRPGPLHGIPVLVKELVDVAGLATAHGSFCYKDQPAAADAPLLARLRAAGANIIGTTHMVEFAMGSWGTNAQRGTPLNPHGGQEDWFPGGSSSGSAVAVAAGFVPLAVGSDTGGSIRIPAALCGIYGFKPSYGLIPLTGVAPLAGSFDTIGALGRSVDDLRLCCGVMADQALEPVEGVPGALHLACVTAADLAPCDAEMLQNYLQIRDRLAAAGHRITDLQLPESLSALQQLNGTIVAYEAWQHFGNIAADPQSRMDPHVRARVMAGAAVSAGTYTAEKARLAQMTADFAQRWSGIDAFVMPGTPIPSAGLEQVDEQTIPLSRYTRLANCLELCGISLPCGQTRSGAPLGLQLCAVSGQDARLLTIAEAIDPLLQG